MIRKTAWADEHDMRLIKLDGSFLFWIYRRIEQIDLKPQLPPKPTESLRLNNSLNDR